MSTTPPTPERTFRQRWTDFWFAPKDLRLFYQVRQNWRGKAVLVKLIWRMFRARVFGDRMAAIGQSLAADTDLALAGLCETQ